VVILLTDGSIIRVRFRLLTAAEAAKALKIKVYTIGAGSRSGALSGKDFFGNTVYQPIESDIDGGYTDKKSRYDGAKYFRATDTKSLR